MAAVFLFFPSERNDPMEFDSAIETIAATIPAELTDIMLETRSFVPMDLDLGHIAKFLLFFAAGALILSVLGRFILGKRSSLNHSVSSVMAILFIYALTIVVYTFKPWNLEEFLSPLPFVTFFGDYMVVMPVVGIDPMVLARELLSLIILAFLVNLLDTFIPQGKTLPGWFVLRLLTIGMATGLYLLSHWAIDAYLPQVLTTYAPIVLLLLLIGMLVLGFLNAVLGLILTATNPVVGAIYTFFFSNIIGKQFTKAVFTSGILSVILFMMDRYGYSFINISIASLTGYVPVGIVSLVLWYLIGHLL